MLLVHEKDMKQTFSCMNKSLTTRKIFDIKLDQNINISTCTYTYTVNK